MTKAINYTDASKYVHPGEVEEVLEHKSPEGKPADPAATPRTLNYLVLGLALLVLLVAILIGVFVNRPAGIMAGALGALMFVTNSEFWAFWARRAERNEVIRDIVITDHRV